MKKFVQETPEAQLATHIFGHDKNVGTALIRFEQINSKAMARKEKCNSSKFKRKNIGYREHNKNVEK